MAATPKRKQVASTTPTKRTAAPKKAQPKPKPAPAPTEAQKIGDGTRWWDK